MCKNCVNTHCSPVTHIYRRKQAVFGTTAKFQQDINQAALDRLECSLSSDEVMAYFDPSKNSILLVDASPVGLGAVLTQDGKVISYASKSPLKCGKALLSNPA